MIRNYYTLLNITKELQKYIGFSIVECFSQEKQSVTIFISDGITEVPLQFNGDGEYDAFYLRYEFNRAKKNTIDLFPDILDETIQSISVIPNNRIIKIELVNTDLYAVLFGGKNSNLYAVAKNGRIFDALTNTENNAGSEFKIPENIVQPFLSHSQGNLLKTLAKSEFLIGKTYAKQILHELKIPENAKIENFKKPDLTKINTYAQKFTNRLKNTDKAFILKKNSEILLSLTQINDYELIETVDSVNKGVQRLIKTKATQSSFEPEIEKISRILEREINKSENKLRGFTDLGSSKKRIEKYRHYGEILAAQQDPNYKPGAEYETKDWEGNKITIPLDDKLNLIQNAEKYFEKAGKSEDDMSVRKKRIPLLQKELNQLRTAYEKLKNISSFKQLKKFKEEYRKILGLKMQDHKKGPEEKFRVFDLGNDYSLYVGKNAKNNDELTMKFAKPNDLWLHARGTSGSHAVLRLNKKEKKPPKDILTKACMITAYYSGARNASLVPVAYTLKKYVRKPKGAAPGAVTINREDVLMAKPELPD